MGVVSVAYAKVVSVPSSLGEVMRHTEVHEGLVGRSRFSALFFGRGHATQIAASQHC